MSIEKHQKKLDDAHYCDETEQIQQLITQTQTPPALTHKIKKQTTTYITKARQHKPTPTEAILQTYNLQSEEGIALLNLAESLLRIPDKKLAQTKITETITNTTWQTQNLLTKSLNLTSKLITEKPTNTPLIKTIKQTIKKITSPILHTTAHQTIQKIADHYIYAPTIEQALAQKTNQLYSYDMLGETAQTQKEATTYIKNYQQAIEKTGQNKKEKKRPARTK